MIFRESALAHQLLDGLEGIEIGGSAHNPFGLNTRNVDYTCEMTIFKQEEIRMCGTTLPVDIVAPADRLPLEDSSVDFVVSSLVIDQLPDPIKALQEWARVIRPGGLIYLVAAHRERTDAKTRSRTTLAELIERNETGLGPDPAAGRCSIWTTEDLVELIEWLKWPVVAVQEKDDKVGNGFTVVARVDKASETPQVATPRARRRLSMTFLLSPSGKVRSAETDCVLEYARGFQERGQHVAIATWPKFLWGAPEPFGQKLDFKIPIHYDLAATEKSLPFHLLNQNPRNPLGELTFFTQYLNLVTRIIPRSDLLVAANWEAVIPAWQSGKGKPVHFAQHYEEALFMLEGDPTVSLLDNPLIKMLCRNAFQMPVYRIANSSWLAGEFRRRFGETVPVVTHGVDTARFHQLPKLSEKDGILRIVTYSRPEKWKGFQDALAAMAELSRRYAGRFEWHVYGFPHPVGPENSFCPYRFHGALDHDALSRLYAESDIVLCPSWYESFPLPPIEAMACGTAVITTRYGTEDYAIDGHTAIVVRPRVVPDFVTALSALLERPELRQRLARNGRAMAESLTWDTAVAAREELLWRIHRNEIPNNAFQGLDTGIADGYGNPFEHLLPEFPAHNGEVLHAADGAHYVVESNRLRRLRNPAAAGLDQVEPRPLDPLMLLRNELGPEVTSLADYYGFAAPRPLPAL